MKYNEANEKEILDELWKIIKKWNLKSFFLVFQDFEVFWSRNTSTYHETAERMRIKIKEIEEELINDKKTTQSNDVEVVHDEYIG